MSRILSLDYGARRTGIAVTDTLQLIANGLTTVPSHQLLKFLQDYVQREPVERFVVGLPRQTNGQDSDNLPRVQAFVRQLEKAFPTIPVEWFDERFTSVMAHQAMLAGGLKKKDRQNKALVDEISACIILQGWMESRRSF